MDKDIFASTKVSQAYNIFKVSNKDFSRAEESNRNFAFGTRGGLHFYGDSSSFSTASVPGSTSINVSFIRNPLGNSTNPSPVAASSALVIYADLEVPSDRINRRALVTRMRFPRSVPHAAFPIQSPPVVVSPSERGPVPALVSKQSHTKLGLDPLDTFRL